MRTVAIDSVVQRFIESNQSNAACQIISLGAGFDTRLFRFNEEFKCDNLKYFELDFKQILEEKRRIVEGKPALKELSKNWRPISCDLNGLSNLSDLLGTEFDPSVPTLIIAECCLMYLTAEAGDKIIAWSAATLKSCHFCSFDPILADNLESDRFAKTMLDNFEDRGLDTRALLEYPSLASTVARFSKHFGAVEGYTMIDLERDESTEFLVSKQQRRELAIKAALDEYEEWELLASHYLFILAHN